MTTIFLNRALRAKPSSDIAALALFCAAGLILSALIAWGSGGILV